MTLDQFGVICNVLGYTIPLVFSFYIARTYSRPFFLNWTLSYLFYSVAIAAFPFIEGQGVWRGWLLGGAVAFHIATWFLLKTADTIIPERPLPRVGAWSWWATLIGFLGPLLAGQSISVALVGPLLMMTVVHYVFARRVMQVPGQQKRHAKTLLAMLVAGAGTWSMTFPVMDQAGVAWIGFVISGALHLVLGIQMVIYLLEDNASLLQSQYEELQQLSRLKNNFISTISHELRTPLTAIKGASYLLESPTPLPNHGELVDIIYQQSEALEHLVRDMLDFSVLESGGMLYHKMRYDLAELADEAVQAIAQRCQEKGLALALEAPENPVPIDGDPERLKQALGYLLANACKFTGPGGHVTVRVSVRDDQAHIAVQDTGIGIPAEAHNKVFERFFQLDGGSTRKTGGAGLGLAICKALIEDGHRGRLWLESTPGAGSTFTAMLPLAGPAGRPAAQAAS